LWLDLLMLDYVTITHYYTIPLKTCYVLTEKAPLVLSTEPRNKSNLLLFRGKVVLVTSSTGACFRTGFKRLWTGFLKRQQVICKMYENTWNWFLPHGWFPNLSCKPSSYLPFTLPFVSVKVSLVTRWAMWVVSIVVGKYVSYHSGY
jgi:hypothetical protein